MIVIEKKVKEAQDSSLTQDMVRREIESAGVEQRKLEEEKDKRREDWAGTNKWGIIYNSAEA